MLPHEKKLLNMILSDNFDILEKRLHRTKFTGINGTSIRQNFGLNDFCKDLNFFACKNNHHYCKFFKNDSQFRKTILCRTYAELIRNNVDC